MNIPAIGSKSDYMKALDEINDCIHDLEEMSGFLNTNHRNRLKKLIGHDLDDEIGFTVDEVEKQFIMVKKIRDQLVQDDGRLLEGTEIREISALISASNSLIALYMKNQAMIDHLKEVALLREAVTYAIKELDKESQAKFFNKFDLITAGVNE